MSDYIKGSTRPHEPAEEEGISLAGFGITPDAMGPWMLLQQALRDNPAPPCTDNPNLFVGTRGAARERAIEICQTCPIKQACLDYGRVSGDMGSVYGGEVI